MAHRSTTLGPLERIGEPRNDRAFRDRGVGRRVPDVFRAYQTTCAFDLRRIESRITLRRCNLEPPRIYASRGPLREAFKPPALEPAMHWEMCVDTASAPCNEAAATPQTRAVQVSLVVFFASFVAAAAPPSDSSDHDEQECSIGVPWSTSLHQALSRVPEVAPFFSFLFGLRLIRTCDMMESKKTKSSAFAPEANVFASLVEVWSTPSSAHINPTQQA